MQRYLILWVAAAVSIALPAAADEPAKTYGDGVTLEQAVAIDALLEHPQDYVGTKIRVDGVITGVCKKRGCWMQVTDPDSGNGVRIKVEDGVIVFPYTAMGHEASAEGVFEAIELTPEQLEARAAASHDHEPGEDCDRSEPARGGGGEGLSCQIPAQDRYVYLIRGTGAVIKG